MEKIISLEYSSRMVIEFDEKYKWADMLIVFGIKVDITPMEIFNKINTDFIPMEEEPICLSCQ